MALDAELLRHLTNDAPGEAWNVIVARTVDIASKPLSIGNAPGEVTKRDREIGALDHFLSTSGWDLWQDFGESVERTSAQLIRWWDEPYAAKAVLILDGLSLRELPWLIHGAKERGFVIGKSGASASELPGETNQFARALGFSSRSQLQDNGGGSSHKLRGARTECVGLPWRECATLVASQPGAKNWLFWHEWPVNKIHAAAGAGQGLDVLTRDVGEQLTSNAFWDFVERLTAGRRLMITSDHGYAATGLFYDAAEAQADYLKATLKSGRSIAGTAENGPFIPPATLQVTNTHGRHVLALGRWKWKSPGGYPTLAHGGLSLLEVLSPFIEITKST